jgi:Cu/Ag efflux protein CusF
MKTISMKSAALAFLPAVMLVTASCSNPVPGELSTTVKKSTTGTTVVDTFKATATVASIDTANRKLTLTLSNGKTKVVKCGPEVVNFHSIQVHDRVRVTMTEELAVYLDKGKPAAGPSGSAMVALTPLGAKPGVVAADTVQATVKVSAIDTSTRKVTVRTQDGKTEIFKAGEHINLTKVKVGDSVTIRRTEAVGLLVEKY